MNKSLFYSVLCLVSLVLLPACGCRSGCVSIMDKCNEQMECCESDRCDSNACDTGCEIDVCDVEVDADIDWQPSKRIKETADVTSINQL